MTVAENHTIAGEAPLRWLALGWRDRPRQPDPAGTLHDMKGCREQRVAAESKNHRRGMKRPDATEGRPGQIEIQGRKNKLQRDE
jgi:hypothetical protein